MALKPREIKIALVRHGKTNREIAEAVGLSPSAFSRLIHGHRRADPALLRRIEEAIRSPRPAKVEETKHLVSISTSREVGSREGGPR